MAGKPEKDTIMWVKTITDAAKMTSIKLVVEDAKKNCMEIFLYN